VSWAIPKTVLPLCLYCLVLGAACGTGPTAEGADVTKTTGPSSAIPGVFFAQRPPGGADMLAEIRGELVLDERGCLRVRHRGGSSVTVWPSGFELERSDGGVRILDREGEVVAKVGEAVYMGGGGTPIRGNEAVDDGTRRELLKRCPGSYWVAATPVRIPRP
jgi:hypothetical protein